MSAAPKDVSVAISPAVSPGLASTLGPGMAGSSHDASDIGKVLEELKCAICLEPVMHRGYECSNSHLIHRTCYFAMPFEAKTCPTCRVDMAKPDPASTVTRLARHLIKKCCYCNKKFDSEPSLKDHLEMCENRLFVCPHAEMGDAARGSASRCSQIRNAADMVAHMAKGHETSVSEQRTDIPFRVHTLVPPTQQQDAATPAGRRQLVSVYNPPFVVALSWSSRSGQERKLWFVVDTRFRAGIFSLAVRVIGPAANPEFTCRYAARMRMEGAERMFSSVVPSIDKVGAHDVFAQGRCATALACNLVLEKRVQDPQQDGAGDYATSEIVIRVEEAGDGPSPFN